MSLSMKKKLYRSRDGLVFGVCKGIAQWRDLSVDLVRIFFIIFVLATGFFPGVVTYFVLGLFLPLEPVHPEEFKRSGPSWKEKKEEADKENLWDKKFYNKKS